MSTAANVDQSPESVDALDNQPEPTASNHSRGEERKAKKCPECVAGAPAWMATFSDMATLLLCFFVLILSFAEMNVPKFKQISGSMNNAFGVQKDIPVVEQPKGTTLLSLSFSPSPTLALVDNLKQETTDTTQPEIEVRQQDQELRTESVFEAGARLPTDSSKPGGQGGVTPDSIEEDAAKIREALANEISKGAVDVKTSSTRVTVSFNSKENTAASERLLAAQAIASGVKKISSLAQQLQSEVAVTGATQALVSAIEKQSADGTASGNSGTSAEKVESTAKAFEAAFSGEIKDGLVKVERKDGAVLVKIDRAAPLQQGTRR